MPSFRDEILASTETVSSLGISAEARFADAQQLLVGGRFVGSLYNAGLAAEMWLKLACFRRLGARAADPVGPFARRVDAFLSAGLSVTTFRLYKESGHSLHYWADFLLTFAQVPGGVINRRLAGDLRHHVRNRLYNDWHLFLRYRAIRVPPEHLHRVIADVGWLRANWLELGRR